MDGEDGDGEDGRWEVVIEMGGGGWRTVGFGASDDGGSGM